MQQKPFSILRFLISTLFFCQLAIAALPDSTLEQSEAATDTARLFSDQPIKSPWGAVLRSAIVPGWGQVYNKAPLKGVFFAASHAALIWKVSHHHNRYKDLMLAGSDLDEDEKNSRNVYIWYTGLAYLITMVDAYVDAYLFGFDDAMNISLREPKTDDSTALVLTFQFKL